MKESFLSIRKRSIVERRSRIEFVPLTQPLSTSSSIQKSSEAKEDNMFSKEAATEEQTVDYVLGKEVLSQSRITLKHGEAIRIQGVLAKDYNIHVSTQKISARTGQLRNGLSAFSPSGDYNGQPGKRSGKDTNYAGFWTLVDAFLPSRFERRYIGLAANQMDVIRNHISYHPVVVVERDKERAEELKAMAEVLNKVRLIPKIEVIEGDIFDMLPFYDANILDLDLMCAFPEDPTFWVETLNLIKETTVLNITTCIGRFVTEKEYNDRTKRFRDQLVGNGVEIVARSPFSYRDRFTPMRAERLVIRKKEIENG